MNVVLVWKHKKLVFGLRAVLKLGPYMFGQAL